MRFKLTFALLRVKESYSVCSNLYVSIYLPIYLIFENKYDIVH